MEIKQLKVKILKHFGASSDSNFDSGMSWYERAHNECLLISQVFEVPLSIVIGIVAALSPSNKWKQNLKDTWSFLEEPNVNTKVCTFMNQRWKALEIYNTEGTDEEIKAILNGDKTKNFYDNILYYSSSDLVTVDRWAYRSVGLNPSKANFKKVEVAYKEVAEELDLRPHQVQAVVWGVTRGAIA
jgi:hypothetical protein